MNNLNTINLIKGKIGTLVNKFNRVDPLGKAEGYKLVKDLSSVHTNKKNRVGVYLKDNKKIVIKRHKYSAPDLDYSYLINEAVILKTINKIIKAKRIFPKLITTFQEKGQIDVLTEFISGQTIDNTSKKIRIEAIKACLVQLRALSDKFNEDEIKNLPERSYFLYFFGFNLNLIKILLKNPKDFKRYMVWGFYFYLNFILSILKRSESRLVHRDLYPDNIIYLRKNKLVKILDWESAVISDPLYDLAQVAMIYTRDFGVGEIINIVNEHLSGNTKRRRFIAFALYNSGLILANHNRNDKEFKEVEEFVNVLLKEIAPKLIRKISIFEIINSFTMDMIVIFYNLTGFSSISKRKKIILCYHSVGNNGWRFSTRIDDFKKQIEFLRKNYNLVSLPKLLKKNTTGLNISFDDGYVDVYKNALPILGKIPATMFALGDYTKANDVALDNKLPKIDDQQIRSLKKKGWEIGHHTRTHSDLDSLNSRQLSEEIFESKKEFEGRLGFKVNYFAYPKGFYSSEIIDLVKKSGFKAAFTVDGKELKLSEDPMLFDRVPMEGEYNVEQLEALLSPLGLFITGIYMKILQTKVTIINEYKILSAQLDYLIKNKFSKEVR